MRLPLRTVIAATSLTLLLAGCGDAPEREPASTENLTDSIPLADDFDENAHFGWAYTQYASSWDPSKSIGGGDVSFYTAVYDRLLQLTEDGGFDPMLAEAYTAEGNTLTLELRPGLTYSDGTPFDAESVKFNLERNAGATSTIASEVAQFESATVLDELTIEITVSSGLAAFLTGIAGRAGMMISPAAVESGTIEDGPVGIGPYLATTMTPGDRVEFERTPDYWDPDAQNVATMTYYLMVDDQTRYNALQSGEVDGAFLNPNQIDTALNADLQVIAGESTSFVYFMMNPLKEPFDDPKVREAMNYAIDRTTIAEGLYEGYCTPGIQPWPSTSPGYSEEIGDGLDIWPHDPEKATELLAEAGYPDGFEFTAVTTNVTQYQTLSEAIQEQVKEAGLQMIIEPLPSPQIIEKFVLNQEAEVSVNPYTGLGDPHGVLTRHYMAGGTYGFGGALDDATVELAMEASGPVDPAERRPIYSQIMQSVIDTPAHLVPLCSVHLAAAFSPQVSGVSQSFTGASDLRGVAISNE